ncbi:hypothetical protein STEG23_024621, partial [Scotinomys teguina]
MARLEPMKGQNRKVIKSLGVHSLALRFWKASDGVEFIVIRGECTGSPDQASLVGTAFSSKTVGLVYTCFIRSYSNLFTRDRNPDCSEDVGNQNDACENEINQYEDGEQQSITEGLFDNNEIEETVSGRGANESSGNVNDNNEASKMAQQVKSLATKSDNMNSIPKTGM